MESCQQPLSLYCNLNFSILLSGVGIAVCIIFLQIRDLPLKYIFAAIKLKDRF